MPSDNNNSKPPALSNVNFIARSLAFASNDANRLRELAKVNTMWKEAVCCWNGGRTQKALFDEALKACYLSDNVFVDKETPNIELLIRRNPFARKNEFLLADLTDAELSIRPTADTSFSRYKLYFEPGAFKSQFDVLARYASRGEHDGRGVSLEEVTHSLTEDDHAFFVATAQLGYSNILQCLVWLYLQIDPSGALLRSALEARPGMGIKAIEHACSAKTRCAQTMEILFSAYKLLYNTKEALLNTLTSGPHDCPTVLLGAAGRKSQDTVVLAVVKMYSEADPSGVLLREALQYSSCACLMEAVGSKSLANLTAVLQLYREQGSDFLKHALTESAEGMDEIYDRYGAIQLAQEDGNEEIITELLRAYQEVDLLQEVKVFLRPEHLDLLEKLEARNNAYLQNR